MTDLTQDPPPKAQDLPPPEKKVEEEKVELVPASELLKYQKQLKEMEDKAKKSEDELKRKELADLEKNQEWQKVAEMKAKEAEDATTKYSNLKEGMIRREKYNALAQACLGAGILKEAMGDLGNVDLKELKIETNSEGDFSVIGADKMVQKLKTLKPHWFKQAQPNLNPNTPSTTSSSAGSATWESLKKLESEYKKNPTKTNEDAYRTALLAFKK